MFFDEHPEFLHTSQTAATKGRLNLRHLGIIKENEAILRGRSVVDIASSIGRASRLLRRDAMGVTQGLGEPQ